MNFKIYETFNCMHFRCTEKNYNTNPRKIGISFAASEMFFELPLNNQIVQEYLQQTFILLLPF